MIDVQSGRSDIVVSISRWIHQKRHDLYEPERGELYIVILYKNGWIGRQGWTIFKRWVGRHFGDIFWNHLGDFFTKKTSDPRVDYPWDGIEFVFELSHDEKNFKRKSWRWKTINFHFHGAWWSRPPRDCNISINHNENFLFLDSKHMWQRSAPLRTCVLT
jgi:hypothetical protein